MSATPAEPTVFRALWQRPTGLSRRLMFGLGFLAAIMLILDGGFTLGPVVEQWLRRFELGLAAVYLTDRLLMLRTGADLRVVLRQRQFEFGVLGLFLLVSVDLLSAGPMSAALLRFLQTATTQDLGDRLVKLFLLANVLVQLLRLQQGILVRGVRPEWILTGSFLLLILAGTLLLLLPRASASPNRPLGLVDALFTSASASCVTGLAVRDTGTEFSPLGQGVLLGLIQVGGLGIMTFVAFLAVTSAPSLPVPHMLAFKRMVMARSLAGLKRQVWAIILFTALVEALGALCLYACLPADRDPLERLGWSVFHAVSAFCNAGFALQADSLIPFRDQPGMMLTFMGLIVCGGLGFLVVTDLLGLQLTRLPLLRRVRWVRRYNQRHPVYRLPAQTRLSAGVTGLLIVVGTLGFWALESRHGGRQLALGDQWLNAAFQSVTARTAGFNTVAIDQLQPATLLLLMVLMVIGACPVSTGGGIKTVTLAVLVLALRTWVTGRERVEVFGRALPAKVLFAALGVVVLYLVTAGLAVFGLALCDPQVPLRDTAFEAVSALSTVGLSTGITPRLSTGSKLILCAVMFIGRVGPISLALSVFQSERPARYQYPEEDLVVG